MTIRDQSESLVQDLYDRACDGEVDEIMIFLRTADGQMLCAYASEDMRAFIDDARSALAGVENEMDAPACSRRLN